jgi:hypothetical protein
MFATEVLLSSTEIYHPHFKIDFSRLHKEIIFQREFWNLGPGKAKYFTFKWY